MVEHPMIGHNGVIHEPLHCEREETRRGCTHRGLYNGVWREDCGDDAHPMSESKECSQHTLDGYEAEQIKLTERGEVDVEIQLALSEWRGRVRRGE